jgi:hypothetical protein
MMGCVTLTLNLPLPLLDLGLPPRMADFASTCHCHHAVTIPHSSAG